MKINKILLCGVGGGGGLLLPSLACSFESVVVADGDTYEEKNLGRQPFTEIGKNKATAAADFYSSKYPGVSAHPEMLKGHEDFDVDLIISCVDSNHGRVAAKALADKHDIPLIVCQNDVRDSEAYLYLSGTDGTEMDPYYRYNLHNLEEGRTHCEGEEEVDPIEQTAFSNMASAGAGTLILQSLLHEAKPKNYIAEIRNIPLPQTKKMRFFIEA